MTMTNASSSARGRRVKFSPQAIEKIKELVAEGLSRDEIANRVGVTVGSLQVTCSRLGISLRRIILTNGSERHTLDVHGRTIPTPSQQAARATPLANFAIMMRHRGKEQATDIPLSSAAMEALALEAMSRDLYRVPEIVTRGRFPDGGESDSTWRTQEARHVGSDTIAPGF